MLADHVQIEQIRFELTWRIRHVVMYPDLPFDAIKLPEDPEGIHFGLYVGDQLVSVVSVFNSGTVYQFRKFATLNPFQNKGYGSMLLSYIIEFISHEGGTRLWCNARVSAMGFYDKFGFKATDQYFEEHGIDFVIMELELGAAVDA